MSENLMLIVPDPNSIDPQALAERRRQKARRRTALWGAFLVLGLALGTIYATGFASVGGSDGTTADAAANTNTPAGNEDTSELATAISTPNGPLNYNWDGRWGAVQTEVMYAVNLTTAATPNTEDFYVEVLLNNTPSGFSDLQLQLRIAPDGPDNACDSTDLENTDPTNNRVMIFDNADAQVTFSGLGGATTGLPGNERYCVGVVNYGPNPTAGKDTGGTFIRKAAAGASFGGNYPSFVATVNRMP